MKDIGESSSVLAVESGTVEGTVVGILIVVWIFGFDQLQDQPSGVKKLPSSFDRETSQVRHQFAAPVWKTLRVPWSPPGRR